MPDYQTARRGVQQSEDLLEAANVAPTSRTIVETFEVWHSSLAEPIYLAANPEDFVGVKEADADRDAGSAVTFLAAPIVFSPPEENDEASAPETSLTFPNISDLVSQALRDARGSLDPWIIIERVYASDDPSGPAQLPPLSLLIEAFTITGTEVTMVLGYGDPADVSVPVLKFRRNEYPTLQP
jgi:hypothetical protein